MSSRKSRQDKKSPVVIKRGSVSVKIYHTPSHGRDLFTVSHYLGDERKRSWFSSFEAAKTEAEFVAARLASTDSAILKLSGADLSAYQRARQHLDPIGVAIEIAAAEFAEAKKRLGGVPLSHAVEFYLKRNAVDVKPIMVSKVVEELIAAKQSDKLSDKYLICLRWSLGKFVEAFSCNIGDVTAPQIDDWLRSLGLAPRTRNNLRSAVKTLFEYAKSRRYVSKDNDEVDSVPLAKDKDEEIEIFKPCELEEILAHAGERMIPFIVLGAFAGIRHAELQRLEWQDIHFSDGIIEIKAAKAKTASRRTVPLLDNLRNWLLEHRKDSGSVCLYQDTAFELKRITRRINEARRAAWAKEKNVNAKAMKSNEQDSRQSAAEAKPPRRGEIPPGAETAKAEGWQPFKWKHNALRHSFISYRVAETKNVPQVALEAGNSPQIIFSNYRELVRPAEALKWFSIRPKETGNIIQLTQKFSASSSGNAHVASSEV